MHSVTLKSWANAPLRFAPFKKYFIIPVLFLLTSLNAGAFDLKTHLWLAQQLLNDVTQHKAITINNKKYQLNQQVLAALIQNPANFRMGTLGIDVFPDPIVGQITAHPGLTNGWKTDDWIQHVLNSASNPAEIAFAYGYACHAAMDIFAHTYVNAYSGDIFSLADEVAVERRHFALEKYIGNHLPKLVTADGQLLPDQAALISAPAGFLTKTFILNNKVTGEYLKSGSFHLVAMNGVYNAIKELDNANQKAVSLISTNYLNYLKEQNRLILELDKHVSLTAQAGLQLKLAKEAVDLKVAANQVLLDKIKIERDLIDKGIQAKKDIEGLLQQKHQLLKDGNNLITSLHNDMIDKQGQVLKLSTDIAALPATVSIEVVKKVAGWLPGISELIKITEQVANPAIDKLKKQQNNLIAQITNAQKRIVQTQSDMVIAANDIVQKTEELRQVITNTALAEANEAAYNGQKALLEAEIATLQETYAKAQEIYEKVRKEEDDLRGRLEKFVDEILNVAKDLIERYNLVHLALENWRGDVEKACDAYINAGEKFAKGMLSNGDAGLSHYIEWYKCWSPVFTAIPSELPQAICTFTNYYEKLNSEIDKIMVRLGPLQYLINPTKLVKEHLEKEVKKQTEYAAIQISNHIFGKETTDLFLLLAGREAVTTAKLIEIFKVDGSGKNLLSFENITTVINKEMGITGEESNVDPEKFAALHNALQLSKLSVLNGISLNRLHTDYLGNKGTAYGKRLYPDVDNTSFSILYRAVSSIDGSCQWMQFATPIYRHSGFDQKWPKERSYGYSHCSNGNDGFRFWVDEASRKSIFNVVFKGPLTPELYAYAAYNSENTRFIPCEKNPFPNTADSGCDFLKSNMHCNDNWFTRFFNNLFDRY